MSVNSCVFCIEGTGILKVVEMERDLFGLEQPVLGFRSCDSLVLFVECCLTPEGLRIATQHQNVFIKAFNRLIRMNRRGQDCAQIIASSMLLLRDIKQIKHKCTFDFISVIHRFPFTRPMVSPLVKEIIVEDIDVPELDAL